MMCIKPLRIKNPKYKDRPDQKFWCRCDDYYINVPCGLCFACFKTWQSSWRARLLAEWKYLPPDKQAKSVFITFTFSDKYIKKAVKDAAPFVKSFRDLFRKKYKRSCRFFLVREYGDTTDRLHYHGILFDFPGNRFDLSSLWPFGTTNIKSLSTKRVSYMTKYATKGLNKSIFYDKKYKPKVYCSPGLGKKYVEDPLSYSHLRPFDNKFNLTTQGLGASYNLPRYFRDKMLSDKEKLSLRCDQLLNPLVKPPYYIGDQKFFDLRQYVNRIYDDYKFLTPLVLQLYESSEQNK